MAGAGIGLESGPGGTRSQDGGRADPSVPCRAPGLGQPGDRMECKLLELIQKQRS